VEYAEDHFIEKPVDWLIRDYLKKTAPHRALPTSPLCFSTRLLSLPRTGGGTRPRGFIRM